MYKKGVRRGWSNIMKIGFTGSRSALILSSELLEELSKIDKEKDVIIHGGASGADQLVGKWAEENKVCQIIIHPINRYNKINYLYRNVEIISNSDKLLAFWDGKSRGTQFTIDYAKAREKEVKIVMF